MKKPCLYRSTGNFSWVSASRMLDSLFRASNIKFDFIKYLYQHILYIINITGFVIYSIIMVSITTLTTFQNLKLNKFQNLILFIIKKVL